MVIKCTFKLICGCFASGPEVQTCKIFIASEIDDVVMLEYQEPFHYIYLKPSTQGVRVADISP